MNSRLRFHPVLLAGLLFVLCSYSCRYSGRGSGKGVVELQIVDATSSGHAALQNRALADFERQTGIRIKHVIATERTASVVEEELEWLRGNSAPDVINLDNVWAGTLAPYLLDFTPYLTADERAAFLPKVLAAYQVNNRLVALPRVLDFPLLYFRADLLARYGFASPPQTWDEMADMAARIQRGERAQGNGRFWGYAWEGAPTETLTCAGQEYQISSGSGPILTPAGQSPVNAPAAVHAYERAASWVNTISPPGTPAYVEEDVKHLWEAGNAAFARQWVEEYHASEACFRIAGKVGITVLPHDPGAPAASTVGGGGYAVARTTRHPKEAVALVKFLTARKAQVDRLRIHQELPTLAALYADPALSASLGPLRSLGNHLFESAAPRPAPLAGNQYIQLSSDYATTINAIISGREPAKPALEALSLRLVQSFPRRK